MTTLAAAFVGETFTTHLDLELPAGQTDTLILERYGDPRLKPRTSPIYHDLVDLGRRLDPFWSGSARSDSILIEERWVYSIDVQFGGVSIVLNRIMQERYQVVSLSEADAATLRVAERARARRHEAALQEAEFWLRLDSAQEGGEDS